MTYLGDDTIAATATASGGAARGIVRVSGPAVATIVARCFQSDGPAAFNRAPRAMSVAGETRIKLAHAPPPSTDPMQESLVPCDLFYWPTNLSYTREPVAELHTLGSPPVLEAVLAAVIEAGARLAEPGEFTLRAFLAGRIDLTQAEAVLGLIDARGQDELDASLAQLAGGLARSLDGVRDQLLELLAELEAGLDFVEEDIQFLSREELAERLERAKRRLDEVAGQMASRLALTEADQIALVGPPNVGKSSLFNALVARYGVRVPASDARPHAALVSPRRGTTRDYLTAAIELNGIRCELIDTAGVDERPATTIEAAAQGRAAERHSQAVIRAWCSDGDDEADVPVDCDVAVLTKADVVKRGKRAVPSAEGRFPTIVTSSFTGEGLEALCRELRALLTREASGRGGAVVTATAQRCRDSVRQAEAAVRRAAELVENDAGEELVAAELRGALAELGKVVGAIYTDDLLDRIFSRFCVGK